MKALITLRPPLSNKVTDGLIHIRFNIIHNYHECV